MTGASNGGITSSSNGKGPELSLYDRNRKAHDAIKDSTEITISPRSLNSEIMCPICLDMLKNTMTTKECLHRFCEECIDRALRSGNRECPACRKKLVSKRSLRADPNFDSLISKLYPNREEYEEMQQRALDKLNKHSNAEALQRSIEEGMKLQAKIRKRNKINPADYEYVKRKRGAKKNAEEASARNSPERESSVEAAPSEASAQGHLHDQFVQEMELILRPHPDLEHSSNIPVAVKHTRYLKTTANASVDHLNKYLAMRVQLDTEEAAKNDDRSSDVATAQPNSSDSPAPLQIAEPPLPAHYQLTVTSGHAGVKQKHYNILDGNCTLAEIRSRFWKVKRPLELFFRPLAEAPPPTATHNTLQLAVHSNFENASTHQVQQDVKKEECPMPVAPQQPFNS